MVKICQNRIKSLCHRCDFMDFTIVSFHFEDDVTTRAVRAALQPALEAWKELSGPHSKLRLAGLMVFHCALWRAFGTKDQLNCGDLWGLLVMVKEPSIQSIYPLVMTNSSPWYRWHIEIDGLPIDSIVIFHGYVK